MNEEIDIEWLRPKEASNRLGVSPGTLRRWAKEKKIECQYTSGGHKRFNIRNRIIEHQNNTTNLQTSSTPQKEEKTNGAIYCRVSSNKQKDDLERQISQLKQLYPKYTVFSDICSGLNYKRKGLSRLLERVQKGDFNQVVVAHKDRLARFGTELIEWLFNQSGTALIVQNSKIHSPEQELTEDLMAIIHVFSCRLNGKRRYKETKRKREDGEVKNVQDSKKRRRKKADEVGASK